MPNPSIDLFIKSSVTLLQEPIQAILKRLSKTEKLAHSWEQFYENHINAVAKQFIKDDSSEHLLHPVLTHENYVELLKFINDQNIKLENLTKYILDSKLIVIWRKVEPYRDFSVESRSLLKILFKLSMAYILLEHLENKKEGDCLKAEHIKILDAQLKNSIVNLYNEALKTHVLPEPKREILIDGPAYWELLPGVMIERKLKEALDNLVRLSRSIPILFQADLSLFLFWRNLFWLSKKLLKEIIKLPFVIIFTLSYELLLSPVCAYRVYRNPQAISGFLEKSLHMISGIFSAGLILFSHLKIVGSSFMYSMPGLAGGLLASIASYIGAPLILAGYALAIFSIACLVSAGILRHAIFSFINISSVNKKDIKHRLIEDNKNNFYELFEAQPEYGTLQAVPIHISIEDQVVLSNEEIEDLKQEILQNRFECSNYFLQEELFFKYEKACEKRKERKPEVNTQYSFLMYKQSQAKKLIKAIKIEENNVSNRYC